MSLSATESAEPKGRVEDIRLITGKGRFVDDFVLNNMAYMGFVRSPFAHAKIKGIDISKVQTRSEFIAALTGEDLLKEGVAPVSQNPWPWQRRAGRYHLAVGKVRFVGEPVVAILSNNRDSVEDLIDDIKVDYEPLPVVTTIEESKQKKAILYDDWSDNLSLSSDVKRGDAAAAISGASIVINAKEGIERQAAAPIEPRSVLVSYNREKDLFTVRATVQSVHGLQGHLAEELKMPKEKFHVVTMDVGGGFGSKGAQSYPEPVVGCLFAKKTGMTVKWTATRTEEFYEEATGRDEFCDVVLACDKTGKILALKGNVECDAGVSGTQNHMSSMTLWTMSGPYDIPNVDLHVASYVTNKMPLGPVRGAGAPEGCYFIERAMDIMAKKLGIDPLEFRRRNMLPVSKTREDYSILFDIMKNTAAYPDLLGWRRDLCSKFKDGKSSVIGGIGVSVTGASESGFGQSSGSGGSGQSWQQRAQATRSSSPGSSSWNQQQQSGSSSWQNQQKPSSQGTGASAGAQWTSGGGGQRSSGERQWSGGAGQQTTELSFMSETAKVSWNRDGTVKVFTGSSPHGQGEETTFAQLASEELGVPIEKVTVVWGDTALVPRGIGTFGSRSAATGGSAVVDASRKLKTKLLTAGVGVLGVDQDSIDLRSSSIVDKSQPEKILATIDSVMQKLNVDEITVDTVFTLTGTSYSSGVHLCVLTLDAESYKAKIVNYFVVEDAGIMINKAIVEGQLEGGVVHGIGGALFERLAYDENGNLLTTSFMDYTIPTVLESPDIEIVHKVTPSTVTLDGVKGVGESGTIASYAAVMNALNDALGQLQNSTEEDIAPALSEKVYGILKGS